MSCSEGGEYAGRARDGKRTPVLKGYKGQTCKSARPTYICKEEREKSEEKKRENRRGEEMMGEERSGKEEKRERENREVERRG